MKRHLNKHLKLALILSGLCFFYTSNAQDQDSTEQTLWLKAITVNALAIPMDNHEFGGMIGVLSGKDISQADLTIIAEQFNRIPGVLMQSGTFTTNRIAIRGVGARTAFGTNKIRAYLGEIPLTDGGGETSIEEIDLSFVHSAEIIKGPNSTLFGSGLGGAILLLPRMDTSNAASIRTTVGSFGLFRIGGLVTRANSNQSLTLGFQRQTVDGYRANNSSEKSTAYASARKNVGKSEWQMLAIYLGLKAYIPSSIGKTDFDENPHVAAANWAGAKGFEDYTKWLLGVGWKYHVNDRITNSTSIYANWKNNYEPRPFNILKDNLAGVGFRNRLMFEKSNLELNVGVEGYHDTYNWKTFENILDPDNPRSTQGALLSDNSENRSFFNVFAQSIFHMGQRTNLEAGMNLNTTSYTFRTISDNVEKTFDPVLSPRISVVQSLSDEINAFATVSHGFSPPSIDETLDESGGFNQDIQPETGWNREIGVKADYQKINFALSFFSMDIRNLLVMRRTAEDVTFGKNAGSTRHNGLEAVTEILIYSDRVNQWRMTGSYAFSDFNFRKFNDDGLDYSGNQLTGVPKHQFSATLFQEGKWLFSGLNVLAVSAIPITNDNSVFSSSYQLLNVFAGVRLPVGKRFTTDLTYRMNNVFDRSYAAMLNVNAQAFGSVEPRYYYPGMPRNHQVSLVFSY